jgi:hypothetical protein
VTEKDGELRGKALSMLIGGFAFAGGVKLFAGLWETLFGGDGHEDEDEDEDEDEEEV